MVVWCSWPVSGVIFGYLGGKGVPFFWTKVEGAPKETAEKYGAVTKFFFRQHKNVGAGVGVSDSFACFCFNFSLFVSWT